MSTAAKPVKGNQKDGVHAPASGAATLRDEVLLVMRPANIQSMTPKDLMSVQSKLGFGTTFGIWETSTDWLPPLSRHMARIDFRDRLKSQAVPEEYIEPALLYLVRYAVLLALAPTGSGRSNGRHLALTTLCRILHQTLPRLIKGAVQHMGPDDAAAGSFMSFYTAEDLSEIKSENIQVDLRCELDRIIALCDRGLWADCPQLAARKWSQHYTPDVRGEDRRPKSESKRSKRQPLPDDYIAEGGWRVLWVARDLGPTLLAVAARFADVVAQHPIEGSDVLSDAVAGRRRLEFKHILAEHRWVDSSGNQFDAPPFQLVANVWAGTSLERQEARQWPPTTAAQVVGLLQLLQMSHLWIALLSVGSRIGEMLSFRPGSIVHSSDGTPFANGLTYKLVDQIGGAQRDWPLPDVALDALKQQDTLCGLIHRLGYLGGDPEPDASDINSERRTMWPRVGSRKEFSSDINERLRLMAIALGLTDKPGGTNLTTHRFRKTVARLAALALSGAPKILMDLFGHKSIEMTLHYILSDPDVQAEIKQVVEEVAVMRATDAIEDIDNYGGPAAKKIAGMLVQERVRLGRDLGADDIRQLAEILTLSGQSWALVRPGVICTKLPGSSGPCTKKVGRPEPSRCRWGCDHRLEEAYLRDDIDRSIAEAVRLYELEVADDNEMGQEFWAGQILAHLRRFEDIHRKWATNSTIMQVVRKEALAA